MQFTWKHHRDHRARGVRWLPIGIGFILAGGVQPRAIATEPWEFFPNGVAAGDVDQTSAWLWARLAIAGDGWFEYGADDPCAETNESVDFSVTDPMIPAKIKVKGLVPGCPYHYRACYHHCVDRINCEDICASGSFRTPYAQGHHGLRFGASSCSDGQFRPFVSIKNIPSQDLDFFVHLGDTVYADHPSGEDPDGVCEGGSPCRVGLAKIVAGPGSKCADSIDDFRCWHEKVYSERDVPEDNMLAAARASTAWYVTYDDHEVRDNFAGGAKAKSDDRFSIQDGRSLRDDPTDENGLSDDGRLAPRGDLQPKCDALVNDTELFDNALQVFTEYNPIDPDERYNTPDSPCTTDGERRFYRYRTFGLDAAIMILDARSFRDKETGLAKYLGTRLNRLRTSRTMLGEKQLADLKDDLRRAQDAGITWKFVLIPEPIQNLGGAAAPDRFEGYAHERAELLDYIEAEEIDNVVFVAGDIHGTVANNLRYATGVSTYYSNSWEITTGPIGYPVPYGLNVTDLLKSDKSMIAYKKCDHVAQDASFENLQNDLLRPYLYPLVGLCDGSIDATLLAGRYMAAHTLGWTEFEIDGESHELTVTTYGVDPKPEEDQAMNLQREPEIVSQFVVMPSSSPEPVKGKACESTCAILDEECTDDWDCCGNSVCNRNDCVCPGSLRVGDKCDNNKACTSGRCDSNLRRQVRRCLCTDDAQCDTDNNEKCNANGECEKQ